MNRVIKFRGKRVDNKKWLFGDLVQREDGDFVFPKDAMDSPDSYKIDPSTKGQFWTTWDDIELYDGDVLEAVYVVTKELFSKVKTERITVQLELQWRKDWGGFVFFDRKNENMEHADIMALRNVTKHLGNIHDNPELI